MRAGADGTEEVESEEIGVGSLSPSENELEDGEVEANEDDLIPDELVDGKPAELTPSLIWLDEAGAEDPAMLVNALFDCEPELAAVL